MSFFSACRHLIKKLNPILKCCYAKKITKKFTNKPKFIMNRKEELEKMEYHFEEDLYINIGKYSYYLRTVNDCPTVIRKERNSNKENEEVLNIKDLVNKSDAFFNSVYKDVHIESINVSEDDLIAVSLDINYVEDYVTVVYRISTKEVIAKFSNCNDVIFSSNYPVLKLYYLTYGDNHMNNQLWQYNIESKESVLLYEEKDPEYVLTIRNSGKYVIITSASKNTNEVRIIDENNKLVLFKRREKNVYYVLSNTNNKWIIYTNKYNPNYQIYTSNDLDERSWKLLYEVEDNQTLVDFEIFGPNVVINLSTRIHPEIKILSNEDNKSVYTVNINDQFTCVDYYQNSSEYPNLQIVASNPFTCPQIFNFNYETKELVKIKENNSANEYEDKIKDLCCESYYVKNKNVEIPVTICRNRKTNRFNKSPILAQVYGNYGITLSTEYNPLYLYLLLHGWSIAFCHVRGGGGNGINWVNSGKLLNKMNSIYDYIECCKYLSNLPFVDNRNLFCCGSSAGGITVGAAMNIIEDSSLIKGSLLFSPFLNIIDAISNEERPLSKHEKGEFGDINEKEVRDYIMKYDPYYNIKKKKYPNMFIAAGRNDYRVYYDDVLKYVKRIKLMNEADTTIYFKTLHYGHFGSRFCFDEAIYFLTKMIE